MGLFRPDFLAATEHRPWPMPRAPFAMHMVWEDLLFAHWSFPPEAIARRLPPGLELDTFEGKAWLGIVPFRMSGTRPRFCPPVPGLSSFPELNVRTYVTAGGKPGVWFFSLDAAQWLAVRLARLGFSLPYYDAAMSCRQEGETIHYSSRRTHKGAPAGELRGRYRPISEPRSARPGLETWLVERYCLYACTARGTILRGEIHHDRWPLQDAEAELELNTVSDGWSLPLPDETPLLHFVKRIPVVAWLPHRVRI